MVLKFPKTIQGVFDMLLPVSVSKAIKIFSVVLLTGILLANSIIVAAAFLSLVFIIPGLLFNIPSGITVKRCYSRETLFVGEQLEVTAEMEIESGVGIVVLSDVLPGHFELTGGNNYMVVWKGSSPKKILMKYNIKCTTSGNYYLGNLVWESRHFLTRQIRGGTHSEKKEIEVRPRIMETSKMKGSINFSRIPMPLGNTVKIGMPTLDFKEIKQYSYRDPFRYINWKATARNIYRGGFWPVVNEYEKEGKKVVWIYLNTSRIMNLGTNIRNVFECGLEAVSALADFYLKQSCFVAFSSYNGEKSFLYPASGQKQYHMILKELLKCSNYVKNGSNSGFRRPYTLEEAVIESKKYVEGTRPLFIIVTRYDERFDELLMRGIKEMTKDTVKSGDCYRIMVVNICGHEIAAETEHEKLAARLLDARDTGVYKQLRKRCVWINWNPEETSFYGALMKQVVGK